MLKGGWLLYDWVFLRINQNINVREIIVAMAMQIANILIWEKDLISSLGITVGMYSICGYYALFFR